MQNTRQVTVIRSIPTEMLLPIYTMRAKETQLSTVQLWTVQELSNDSKATVQLCSSPADLSRPQLSPHSRGCVRGSKDPTSCRISELWETRGVFMTRGGLSAMRALRAKNGA